MECEFCESPYETTIGSKHEPLVGKCGHTCCRTCFEEMKDQRCRVCKSWTFQEPQANYAYIGLLEKHKSVLDQLEKLKEGKVTPTDSVKELGDAEEKQESDQEFTPNDEQMEVINAIENGKEKLILMTGPAGTGKTSVYRHLCKLWEGKKKIICTTWTGIAASLLPGGRTISSLFAFFLEENSRLGETQFEERRQILKDSDIIIIDECSMLKKSMFDEIERVLREVISKNDEPFGGKQILLGGDFRQIPPIGNFDDDRGLEELSIINSDHFKKFKIMELKTIMRQNDMEWTSFLIDVGDGKHTQLDLLELLGHLEYDEIYDFLKESCCSGAIITSSNKQANMHNYRALSEIDGEEKCFISTYYSDEKRFSKVDSPYEPPHELKLKDECIVMLTKNLNVKDGLCNGTRLRVVDCSSNDKIICEFVGGNRCDRREIWRVENTMQYKNDNNTKEDFIRNQFPLRLGFAMTIHKSQGQTFDKVVLDLNSSLRHGLLYVALSRCRTKDNIHMDLLLGNCGACGSLYGLPDRKPWTCRECQAYSRCEPCFKREISECEVCDCGHQLAGGENRFVTRMMEQSLEERKLFERAMSEQTAQPSSSAPRTPKKPQATQLEYAFEDAMNEACSRGVRGEELVQLFVTLVSLHKGMPYVVEDMWRTYQDYLKDGSLSEEELRAMIRTQCSDADEYAFTSIDRLLSEEASDDMAEEKVENTTMGKTPNAEQQAAIDAVLQKKNGYVFINGPAGTGKTFVYEIIWHAMRERGETVLCCAWTGIAANLLPQGNTICSLFGLNVKDGCQTTRIKRNDFHWKRLQNAAAIIVDECSMLPRHVFELMDSILRGITGLDQPFGGKIMLLGGDFRQLPPVDENGMKNGQTGIAQCPLFTQNFTTYPLTRIMRTAECDWSKKMLDIGDGLERNVDGFHAISASGLGLNRADEASLGGLMHPKFFDYTTGAILCTRNENVDRYNEHILSCIEGNAKCFEADYPYYDKITAEQALKRDLSASNPPRDPQHCLVLKNNSIVMLTRNINMHAGLCNGVRLQVIDIDYNYILKCKYINGVNKAKIVWIPRIDNFISDEYIMTDRNYSFKRRQFPVRLAHAMTMHKSQGQTMDRIIIDLHGEIFCHGQLYVALSRCTSKNEIYLVDHGCEYVRYIFDERLMPLPICAQ